MTDSHSCRLCAWRALQVAELLLHSDGSCDIAAELPATGMTALHFAAAAVRMPLDAQTDLIRQLIARYAAAAPQRPLAELYNMDGLLPYHLALKTCSLEAIRAFIDAGVPADVHTKEIAWCASAHILVTRGDVDLVRALGPLLDWDSRDSADATPLARAAALSALEMVRTLVSLGASVYSLDKAGHTPYTLVFAAWIAALASVNSDACAATRRVLDVLDTLCCNASCPRGQPAVIACADCRAVFYCCEDCRLAHWKAEHARHCTSLADHTSQLASLRARSPCSIL